MIGLVFEIFKERNKFHTELKIYELYETPFKTDLSKHHQYPLDTVGLYLDLHPDLSNLDQQVTCAFC